MSKIIAKSTDELTTGTQGLAVSAYIRGIKKRARKVSNHIERLCVVSIDFDPTEESEELTKIKQMARDVAMETMREVHGIDLTSWYVEIDGNFVQSQPFHELNFRINNIEIY